MIHDIIVVFVNFGIIGIIIGNLIIWATCFLMMKYKVKLTWMQSAIMANLAVSIINIVGSAIVNFDTAYILMDSMK